MIPKPGIYYGVPFAEYLTWECASKTLLARLRKSPLHAITPLEQTAAMAAGTMAHTLILEPAKFERLYAVGPCDNKALKAWRDWEAVLPAGVTGVKQSEVDEVIACRASVLRKPKLANLLNTITATEVSFVWIDPETGVLCKGRADSLADSTGVVGDLKFTADASPEAFGRSVLNLGYHYGAALYLDGLRACGWDARSLVYLCLERGAPYECAAYGLDETWLDIARAELNPLLKEWAECQRTGVWPGYPDQVQDLSPPDWLVDRALAFGLTA